MSQDTSSGYAALRHGAALVGRTTGRLLVRGADRRAYLQGLLTNDIAALAPGTGCYAAMLNAQGRMITDMRVLELGEAVLLDVPAGLTRTVGDHLARFVFAEDVQVEDATAPRAELGLYGPRALDVLQSAPMEGTPPSTLFASTPVTIAGRPAVVVRSDEIGVDGFDVFVPAEDAGLVRSALAAAGAPIASEQDVDTVRVESGRPLFGVDMDGDTIPLEAGLEDRALSRTKGCYVGQEVIIRVLDRGHGRVARRLVGLTLDLAAPVPGHGATIRSADREIGRVTSGVWSPALSRPIALAYVQRDFVEPGTAVSVGEATASVISLPFV
ncbi:MAG TPA: glycine cleavage T C-terminal barrel domain-containing protein [Vicinamibacterales bacterium]